MKPIHDLNTKPPASTFKLDFYLFAIISLILWLLTCYTTQNFVKSNERKFTIFAHNRIDQHTIQALAWQQGRTDLDKNYSYLELANYQGKIYNSFPPVPTLIEFPFTLIFKRNTPNNLILLLTAWCTMLLTFFILEKLTTHRLLSFLISFTFSWGTNVLYLSLSAPVWHQGHIFGLFFATAAFYLLFYSNTALPLIPGALLLGLAVGCRPFYLLYIPLYIYLAAKQYPLKTVLLYIFTGLLPPGIFIGCYNLLRFGSPFDFGHAYLNYESKLPNGVFSFTYLARNLYSAFLRLPVWDKTKNLLIFQGQGNSLLFVSPILFTGIYATFKKRIPLQDKIVLLLTIMTVWLLLLLHHSNGWFQFGYRYSTDLIPLFVMLFGWAFKKIRPWMLALCFYSIAINIYGALWFYYIRNI